MGKTAPTGEILRLPLREHYREPLSAEIGFTGREAELARLTHILSEREAATVLVTGHRGVGKTALVEEALSRIGGSKPAIVRLSLLHVHKPGGQPTEVREYVLRALARGLHFALKDMKGVSSGIKTRIRALYQKTFLRELEHHSVAQKLVAAQAETRSMERRETTVDFSKAVALILGPTLRVLAAAGGVAVALKVATEYGWGAGVAAAILFGAVAVLLGLRITRSSEVEESSLQHVTATDSTTQIGTFDLTAETLEFELRDLLDELAQSKKACVFVIDELDKLEMQEGEQSDVIFSIVASLKNFFALGHGVYVFIASDEFDATLERALREKLYPPQHTMFSDRVLVHALGHADIEKLVDKLLAYPPTTELDYRQFRNYLTWESGNHVFDVLALVDEFVEFDDRGAPWLVAREGSEGDIGWREGNLPEWWRTAAGLQKFVGATYDESIRPSVRDARFNQALWLTLRHVARELLDSGGMEIQQRDYRVPPLEWLADFPERDLTDISGAVERLLVRLERRRFTEVVVEARSREVDGQVIEEPFDQHQLVRSPAYPDADVASDRVLTRFESSFVDVATRLDQMAENATGAGVQLSDFSDELASVTSLRSRVESTKARFAVPRHEVAEGYQRVDSLGEVLVQRSLADVVERWASDNGWQCVSDLAQAEDRTGQPWAESLRPDFADLVAELEKGDVGYRMVGGAGSENQLAVVLDPVDDQITQLQEVYGNAFPGDKGREQRRLRLPIVIATTAESGTVLEVPTEIVQEVFDTAGGPGFLGRFQKKKKDRVRKKEVPLSGWYVVSIASTLENLPELATKLEEVSYLK